jgi:hypothetical protein
MSSTIRTSFHRRSRSRSFPPGALALLALGIGLVSLIGLDAFPGGGRRAEAKPCPTLTILLDQSASMTQSPMGLAESDPKKQKWGIATRALTQLNNRYTGFLPIGYGNFPTENRSCTVDENHPQSWIPVGYMNQPKINNAMIAFPFTGGSTPTCEAIRKLAAKLKTQETGRSAHYVLLVTDGAPAPDCCGTSANMDMGSPDPVKTTVDAIRAAAQQSPPVKTIVVGFGQLDAAARDAMNQMALAGGAPDTTDPNFKFYRAEDEANLDAAIGRILSVILGSGDVGSVGTCEDGCYGTPCPAGQYCKQNQCQPDPCAGVTCIPGQACSAEGSCVPICSITCPAGSSCDRGRCIADPCSGSCTVGQKCDTASGRCTPDTMCQNIICHTSQGCFGGQCLDDPCQRITCPMDTRCRPFNGSCEAINTGGAEASGCACDLSKRSSTPMSTGLGIASGLLLIAAALRLRRRRGSLRG